MTRPDDAPPGALLRVLLDRSVAGPALDWERVATARRAARRRRVVSVAVATALLAGTGAAVGLVPRGGDVRTLAADHAPTNAAAGAEWLDVGNQIRAGRSSGYGPYLTRPVTIDHDGHYDLLAGPLSDADVTSRFTGVSFPPDTPEHFVVGGWLFAPPEVRYVDGRPYVVVPIEVSGLRAPYVGFDAWLQ